MEINKIYHGDCIELMQNIESNSIDCILTDPPYCYLKHKLDREFNEPKFIAEAKRIVKNKGFVVMFGRGESFYRRNYLLQEAGFKFLEEVVWNKRYAPSPFQVLTRIHETISIYNNGDGAVNKVRVPYENEIDVNIIQNDLRRLMTGLNGLDRKGMLETILNNTVNYVSSGPSKHQITCGSGGQKAARASLCAYKILNGFVEKSIIALPREHYTMKHPTQKPIKLMRRLLNLISKEGDLILDPFMGGGSTIVACLLAKRNYIGIEIDQEYYDIAVKRTQKEIEDISQQLF